jgi:hypothetical protein
MMLKRILLSPDPATGGDAPVPTPAPAVTPANPPATPAPVPAPEPSTAPAATGAPPRVALAVAQGKTEEQIAVEMELERERNKRIQAERDAAQLLDENRRLKNPPNPAPSKADKSFLQKYLDGEDE